MLKKRIKKLWPSEFRNPVNIWKNILDICGWTVNITAPQRNKCVICVAPHTSNWDFIIGISAYKSIGRKANFLMKDFWFFFPLKYLLRALGGIPVYRKRSGQSLTEQAIDMYRDNGYVNLAVTPEGTRSPTDKWHTGFLYIAYGAEVPVQLGVIDYKNKEIIIKDEFFPTRDIHKDMEKIKNYYRVFNDAGRHPDKFKV